MCMLPSRTRINHVLCTYQHRVTRCGHSSANSANHLQRYMNAATSNTRTRRLDAPPPSPISKPHNISLFLPESIFAVASRGSPSHHRGRRLPTASKPATAPSHGAHGRLLPPDHHRHYCRPTALHETGSTRAAWNKSKPPRHGAIVDNKKCQ